MHDLPATIARVFANFAPVFSRRIWKRAQVLIVGAILAPGARTVASALRAVGLAEDRHFSSYHRVLSRAKWSSRTLARTLLSLLLYAFVPESEPVVVGMDETLERRRGAKIAAKGLYRDACRSSKSIHVKSHGLRWISLMLLAPIPFAGRIWALPFLTLLVPSERYCRERGLRYKTVSEWGRQAIVQLRRWLGGGRIVVVADHNSCALDLLERARRCAVVVVTRMQIRAALYDPRPSYAEFRHLHPRGQYPKKGALQPTLTERLRDPATLWQKAKVAWYGGGVREVEIATGTAVWYHTSRPAVPIRWVIVRDPSGRLDPMALLSTEQELSAEEIVRYFIMRWQVEVTFEEVRAHLGVETQRQWSERAIERTTPALFGLFSLITLCAREYVAEGVALSARCAAWYKKPLPTFSDALALVRQHLWPLEITRTCTLDADVVLIPRALLKRMTNTLTFAA